MTRKIINPFEEKLAEDSILKANREFKSSLFTFLFSYNKENALSLYNCVNRSHYTNVEDLEFEILENALFIRMRNDVSFLFDKTLSLYEHQSTYNPNMPLRGLFYFADLYRKIVSRADLYRSSLVKIPTPSYIVFYNGEDRKNVAGKTMLKLSDAFDKEGNAGDFEWTATMYNINEGCNEELLDTCKILSEYSYFISAVRKYNCDSSLENAILKAIDECIEKGILKDVLTQYRWEVATMSWTEFDEEEYEKVIMEDAHERGIAEGRELGITEGSLSAIRGIMENMNCSPEEAMRLIKIPEVDWSMYLKQIANW